MNRLTYTAGLVIALLGLLAVPAAAQSSYGPTGQDVRQGLAIGFGLGFGDIDCSDCDKTSIDAAGGEFHLGVMLNPQLALGGELWVMVHSEDINDPLVQGTITVYHTLITATATYWLLPRLWVKGGLGAAYASISFESGDVSFEAQSEAGLALMGSAGYEVLTTRRFALDVQFHVGAGFYNSDDEDGAQGSIRNVAFGAGFTWF